MVRGGPNGGLRLNRSNAGGLNWLSTPAVGNMGLGAAFALGRTLSFAFVAGGDPTALAGIVLGGIFSTDKTL